MICATCGERNPEGFRHCGFCGAELAPAVAETRKVVTLVFADVVGSTALGERLDPESVRWVMSSFFELARDVLGRHGGTVEKFIGDAVMAAFGIPLVREDDAVRAVRAAAELRDRLRVFGDEVERRFGRGIGVRIGVNTGEVIAGDPAAGQAFASGDAVNVAARLEQAAGAGEVLLGETTMRLVRDAVSVEAAEALALKGKSEPVRAWRLLGVGPRTPGVSRRFDAPLVGRADELEGLLSSWRRTVEDREARVVTIVAPAGTGKTRLLAAVADSVAGAAQVVVGRCLAYGEGITFWPIAEAIRAAADVREEDSAGEARAKLATLLADEPGGDEIVAGIEPLLGLSELHGALEETFWAVRRLFEALARRRSLIVVIDDVHWAEETLLDLIEYLAAWTRSAPLLLLCSARPELLERRRAVVSPRGNADLLTLEPLGSEAAEELLAWQLGASPLEDDLAGRILGASQGNPLFVQELVRMLIDDRAVELRDGRWHAAGEVRELAMPPTIQALLAARLDQLDATERDVAQRASVVGAVFSWSAVRELCTAPTRRDLASRLHALVRKELIVPELESSAAEDAFRFGHVLVRDAAYDSLAKQTRAELHERFADWLEAGRSDRAAEYEEILAYHLEQAARYRMELGDAGRTAEIAGRAAEHLGTVGRRALAAGDLPAAANLLRRAAALLDADDPGRAVALLEAVPPLVETGRAVEAVAMLEEIEGRERPVGVALAARAWTRFVEMQTEGESRSEIAIEVRAWLAWCESAGDHAGMGTAFGFLAKDRFWEGEAAAGEELWRRSAEHASLAGDRREEADALTWLLVAGMYGPTPVPLALARCEEIGNRPGASRKVRVMAAIERGVLEAMAGDIERGRARVAEGRLELESLGLRFLAAALAQEAVYVERSAGNPRAAEALLRPAFGLLGEMGEFAFQRTIAGMLARALYELDELDEAAEFATLMHAEIEDWAGDSEAMRALFAARRGEHDEALVLAEQAVAKATSRDFLFVQAERCADLALVQLLAGRPDSAAAALERADEIYLRKGWRSALASTARLRASLTV